MGINKTNKKIDRQTEQKITIKAYNMKLQFILLASTLALTFSKNIPVPALNKNTERNLSKLSNNAARKAEALLASKGVKVDIDGKLQSAVKAGKPQLDAIKLQANQQYQKFSETYGNWDVAQIIDTLGNKVNQTELKLLLISDRIF